MNDVEIRLHETIHLLDDTWKGLIPYSATSAKQLRRVREYVLQEWVQDILKEARHE